MPKNSCIMQIWAESGKSALPICNYSQILYQFLTFTQNLKRSPRVHLITIRKVRKTAPGGAVPLFYFFRKNSSLLRLGKTTYSQLSMVIPDKNTVISLVAECRKGEELMRALYDFVCSKL